MSSEPLDRGKPGAKAPADNGGDLTSSGSLDELYSLQKDRLERLAWAILRDRGLAADAVQEAFGLLTSQQNKIEWQYVEGWLVRTVQNVSRNLRRKQNRSLVNSEIVGESLGSRVEKLQTSPDDVDDLMQAIKNLPPDQHEIVRRRLTDASSFREIAEELGLPLGTVLSRMRLAIQKLRQALNPEQQEND